MRSIFKAISVWVHAQIHKFLLNNIDISESNDVVKIVTKNIGLAWVEMENHVEIHNKFIVPYKLLEVKLTYYNDAQQNVGYLHFKGPVRIGGFRRHTVKMPAKMSNITALFNVARLLLVDQIKTRTVGTTTIRLFGMTFELPVDDIMIVDKDKIVSEEMDAAEKERKLIEKQEREKHRQAKRAERQAKRKRRLEALERLRKQRRKKSLTKRLQNRTNNKNNEPTINTNTKKEIMDNPSSPKESLTESKIIEPEVESSAPGQDKSYPDPTT